jgi:photosystem II stability/assembly factor-like uncharacterized protein
MKNLYYIPAALFCAHLCNAQEWTGMMDEPGRNFYEIREAFNDHWKNQDTKQKGKGYKQFKRWENFAAPRVYPTGDLSLLSTNFENFNTFLKNSPAARSMQSSNTWTAMGPMGPMSGVASNGFPRKAGRDNFVTFHPSVSSTYWVGAPAGGLWKTTNNGTSWTTSTDYLDVIGCSDMAIDPSNSSTMYLATGDGEQGDTYCIGVLKSTDGGSTWNTTGLVFNVNQQRRMRRLIINPVNPQILIAATNVGIYLTVDAGTNWIQVNSVNSYDVEFNPGNPNIVYAAGAYFMRSVNGGASFTQVSSGIPTAGCNRMNIATTLADASYVYVLGSSSSSSGFQGMYRSTNDGASFTQMSSTPDILANSCTSPSGGGQGWYDLACAASPLNKDEVVVGGVNVWRSTNGGASFNIIGCWIGTGNPPYVHADQHELEYSTAGTLYSCNDGGIFRYTGTAWNDITGQRNIAQIYKIGLSALSPNLWITGHQDNGSGIYSNGTYQASLAGDGMDCFIDRTNNNNMFASQYNGNFYRSTNGGSSWSNITSGLGGASAWVSPWKQDPVIATRLYAGYSQLYVSNNLGTSWSVLGSTGGAGDIVEFAIAPSNNQVIYIIRGTSIRKSINGGSTWTNVTGTIPVGSADPTYIAVDPLDENTAWVTLSGYASGIKIYKTTNGGTSWANISGNLPNLPANCVVYQPSTNGLVYVGMDVGVYYKDNSTTTWSLYNNGLPNVPVSELAISPAAPTKLRAATYGRGVYEVDLLAPPSIPITNFTYPGPICEKLPITFTDISGNTPSSWSWSVTPAPGVIISTPASQNPSITFPAAGTYTVSMTASNSFGTGNTSNKVLTVGAPPQMIISISSNTVCSGDLVGINVTGALNYTWTPGNISGPAISFTAQLMNYNYTITGVAPSGCKSIQEVSVAVSECTSLMSTTYPLEFVKVFPNPATSAIEIQVGLEKAMQLKLQITDVTGKTIEQGGLNASPGNNAYRMSISTLADGIYFLKVVPAEGSAQTIKLLKE